MIKNVVYNTSTDEWNKAESGKVYRGNISITISVFAFLCTVMFPRTLSIPSTVLLIVALLYWIFSQKANWVIYAFVMFEIVTFTGVDIKYRGFNSALPKVCRYFRGRPTPELLESAKKGDIWLAGCVSRGGLAPKWIIVW